MQVNPSDSAELLLSFDSLIVTYDCANNKVVQIRAWRQFYSVDKNRSNAPVKEHIVQKILPLFFWLLVYSFILQEFKVLFIVPVHVTWLFQQKLRFIILDNYFITVYFK